MSFTVTIGLLTVVDLVHQDADHDKLSERVFPGDGLVVMGLGIADACHDTGENLHIALLGVAVADGLTWRDADDGAIHREGFLHQLGAVEFFAGPGFDYISYPGVEGFAGGFYCIGKKLLQCRGGQGPRCR